MNYGDLLFRAHENKCSASNKEVRCYKTSFSPPKKLTKSKVSSENIKKFLARKEEEEKQKLFEAQKRKQELLALRSQDKKAQKRVQVMLKRTKSANKSVMEDAIDYVNTADTLDGPKQCDEDDYGYVSQEASAFYNKLINKYENMPPEPSIFSKKRKEVKDLAAAKDRVKIALQREAEEAVLPHKRKRKSQHDTNANDFINDSDTGDDSEEQIYVPESVEQIKQRAEKTMDKQKIKRNLAPPPPDFNELLKIAKEKQHEPIMIMTNVEPKETQRLMTSKEKAEFIKEEERKRNRINKLKSGNSSTVSFDNKVKQNDAPKKSILQMKKIPKLSSISPQNNKGKEKSTEVDKQQTPSYKIKSDIKSKQPIPDCEARLKKSADVWGKPCNNSQYKEIKRDTNDFCRKSKSSDLLRPPTVDKMLKSEHARQALIKKNLSEEYVPKPKVSIKNVNKELSDIDREIELLRKKKMLLALKAQEKKAPTPKYVPTAIKPQPKVQQKEIQHKEKENKLNKRKPILKKRVIESESEYDSELEDFIEDNEPDEEDYSKVIGEIFGYDKSRYRDVDDDEECMVSNFAQQMREEFVSTRIGILEDLEDIRKEQEEKKRLKAKKKLK